MKMDILFQIILQELYLNVIQFVKLALKNILKQVLIVIHAIMSNIILKLEIVY